MKGCGVIVAMLQGHSWTPTPSSGWKVNVGTDPLVPPCRSLEMAEGKARCQPMPTGRGGGPVVVRGRESRSHGEGVQRARSQSALCGGRW
jgi:hypothetical protein